MRVRLAVVTLLIVMILPLAYAGSSYASATPISTDGTPTTFTFTSDETFYASFPATAGTIYEARTVGTGTIDTFLEIRWPNQALLAENQYDFSTSTGSDSRILFSAPNTGTYYATLTEAANRVGDADLIITELGTLAGTMVTEPLSVDREDTFTITTNVTCTGGPCGTVTAILDPIPELPRGVKMQGERANVEIRYAHFDARTARQRTITAEQELTMATLELLKDHPAVVSIEPNLIAHTMLDSSAPSIRADEAIQQVFAGVTLRGQQHTVCVIDTGVDYRHPDLGGCDATSNINDGSCEKVIGGYNYVEGNNNPMDDNGHGTHVAATVASTHGTYTGVAPDTKIVAMRALGTSGSGSFTNVRNSVDWCTDNAETLNITAIVMSLGTSDPYVNNCDYLMPSFRTSVNNALAKNITVFAAAGNQYSTYPWLGMSFPACISNVIAIGATSDAGAWSSYTKRDVTLDMTAPGNSVTAARHDSTGHTTKSGTSMATPHAAALGVLVRQRMELLHGRPLTPDEVRWGLISSGVPRQDSTTQPNSGLVRNRIDAMNATNIKGVVPMTEGATPFWTPTQNPDTCGYMNDGDTCSHTWTVHATGELGGYTFFTIYENEYSYTETPRIIVTITQPPEGDQTPPVTTDDAPLTWQNESFTVTLNATDDDSGVNYTTYRLNEATWTNGTEILIETQGNNTLEYYSVDNEGNVEETKTTHALLDLTLPSTTDNASAQWSRFEQTIELVAIDDLSGINSTQYRVGEGEWETGTTVLVDEEGNTTLTYYSVDNAGNIEEQQSTNILIDQTPPVTTDNAPTGWQNAPVNVTLSATDALSEVNATFYSLSGEFVPGTWVAIEEGNHTLTYYSQDNAGNQEEEKSVAVLVDQTPPETTTNAPTSWQNDSVNVTFVASDSLSGVSLTEYRVAGGSWVLGDWVLVESEGETLVEYRSTDNAGNVEETKNHTVRINTAAPVTTDDAPSGWQDEPVTVTLSPTDGVSGVNQTRWRLNSGSWNTGTTVLVNDEGNNTLQYYSSDNAGNTEETRTTHVLIDTTAPTTTTPAPNTWQNDSVNVTFVASDSLSGVSLTEYRVAGGSWLSGDWVLVESEGETLVEYRSTDNAGNQETTRSRTIRIDQTPPTTTNNAPSGWQSASVTVTLSATDGLSGVGETRWRLNSGSWNAGTSVLVNAQGNNTLQYYSVDAVGNTEPTRNTTVLVETTGAVVTNTQTTKPVGPGEQATVTFQANSASGITSARLLSPENKNATFSNGKWRVNTTFDSAGVQPLLIRTTTVAGQVQEHTPSITVYQKEQETQTDLTQQRTYTQARTRIQAPTTTPVNLTVYSSNTQPPEIPALANLRRVVNKTIQTSTPPAWIFLTIEFSPEDVAGLDATTLGLHYYNTSTQQWLPLTPGNPSQVISTGVDVSQGIAWANLTRLSTYALAGTPPPPSTGSGGGGGGGGGGGSATGGGGGGGAPQEVSEELEQTYALRFFQQGEAQIATFTSTQIPVTRALIVPDEDGTVAQITAARLEERIAQRQQAAFSITSGVSLQYADVTFKATGEAQLTTTQGDVISARQIQEGLYEARITQWGTYAITTPAPEPEPVVVAEPELVVEQEEPEIQEPAVIQEVKETQEERGWIKNGIPIPMLITGVALVLLGLVIVEQRELRRRILHQEVETPQH